METKFPEQRLFFSSMHNRRDVHALILMLVSMSTLLSNHSAGTWVLNLLTLLDPDIAKEYPHSLGLNVLVIGMPNVGKSTLLNRLRGLGLQRSERIFHFYCTRPN
jgi:hypothetical protein